MSDSAPEPAPAAAPASAPTPAPAALTPAQTSGALFVRWNVGTLLVAALAFVGGAFVVRANPSARAAWDPAGLLTDARWDDGRAEVARYAARSQVDGKELTGEVVRVATLLTEGVRSVEIHTGPTGQRYDLRRSVGLLLDRRDPRRVLAAEAVSSDWRGTTTVRLRRAGGTLVRDVAVVLEGHVAEDRLEGEPWLEDQLPLLLRAVDWSAQDRLEVALLPAGSSARPAPAQVARAGFEQVKTPAGTFDCVRVEVTSGERMWRFWLATTGEHARTRPLVAWQDAAGRFELTSIERRAWQ